MRKEKQDSEDLSLQEFDRSENERSESMREEKQDSENLSRQEFDRSEMKRANLYGKKNKMQKIFSCKNLTEAKKGDS